MTDLKVKDKQKGKKITKIPTKQRTARNLLLSFFYAYYWKERSYSQSSTTLCIFCWDFIFQTL